MSVLSFHEDTFNMFAHRKLKVYSRALEVTAMIVVRLKDVNPGWSELIDQIKRATTSMVLNLAEGASEFKPDEKLRFYRMSLRSAAEISAGFDLIEVVGVLDKGSNEDIQQGLQEVAAMTGAMITKVDARPRSKRR